MIPDMGASFAVEEFRTFASNTPYSVVEIGSWLGRGTVALAEGAAISGAHLHVYDRWLASPDEVRKAAAQGLKLSEGQNLLPIVKRNLEHSTAKITFHRGDFLKSTWCGDPIGMYVDDAAKTRTLFEHALRTFSPFWVDGAVLFLMDYYYYEKRGRKYAYQKEVLTRFPKSFEEIEIPSRIYTSHAAFRFRDSDSRFRSWVKEELGPPFSPRSILKNWIARLQRFD